MSNDTLLNELISTLSAKEIKLFGQFLRSPYFNKNELMPTLLDALQTRPVPDSAALFRQLWPAEAYNDSRMRSANSQLLDLLELFLLNQELRNAPESLPRRLLEVYRMRKATKNFQATLRKVRQQDQQTTHRHAEHYGEQLQIEWTLYRRMAADKRTEQLNLQAVSDNMDLAYMTQKMRLMCLAVSHQSVYTTQYDTGLFDDMLRYVNDRNLIQHPAIGLYYHCYTFLTQPNDNQAFVAFNALLEQSTYLFPHDELRTFYLLAINYGIQQINTGKTAWQHQTFELYRAALSRQLLLEDGVLSRFAFNNIVAVGLRTGHADWTEQFIHDFGPSLDRSYRKVTISMNMARVAYAKKDYHNALQHLQQSDYKDLINNFIVKILQLKIYYELREFDLLESHLNNMQNYMRRKVTIGYHRESYRLLIQYARRLMLLNPFDKTDRAELSAAILEEKGLIEKAWFLAQIGET
jgi:hypothetical protein